MRKRSFLFVVPVFFAWAAVAGAQQTTQSAGAPAAPAGTAATTAGHAKPSSSAHQGSKTSAKLAEPKGADELQADLTAALHADPFSQDAMVSTLEDKTVTVTGVVHDAERKGLATRALRQVAQKDGWTGVHVINQATVDLKH